MNREEERKLLGHILEAIEGGTHERWARHATLIHGGATIVIAAVALWLAFNPQLVDAPRIISLLVVLFTGAMLGAVSTWKLLTQNSRYVSKFIDEERVRARLAELAA